MAKFYAYLEDFHEISVIVPHSYRKDTIKTFEAHGNDDIIHCEVVSRTNIGNECKYILRFDGYILLNKHYELFDDQGSKTELFTGKIVRTELFDDIYYYDGDDLGHTYKKHATTFKLWSPVAKAMKVLVTQEESTKTYELEYANTGVWSVTVEGNLDGAKYLFQSYVNGKEHTFTDPYGIASTANGTHSYVINTQRLYKMKHARPSFSGKPTDAILYEMSVRDFTYDEGINAKNRSQYLGVVEKNLRTPKGNSAGFDYIKTLGITHVQMMPMYDFETVDETDPFRLYNWGYDPQQYNVPEGSFSSDPNDPYKRLNELKRMVDKLHKNNLRITMDVVYNHVYNTKTFPFDKIIPGYAYRVDSQGILSNASGCESDVASERKMIRKFIIDSVLYWAKYYKIDGFRFDLMGLIDVKTMNMLRQKLEHYNNTIIVYGEGWQMGGPLPSKDLAHMYNKNVLFNIGHFNDATREVIKGATFNLKNKGYAMGENKHTEKVKGILRGSVLEERMFRYPSQSINYVECHDNNTFFDKASVALKEESLENIRRTQKLATSLVLLSQGVPFIHCGQEFYRSKEGVENSYKSPDSINHVNWDLVDLYQDDIEYFKTLVRIRKEEKLLRLSNAHKIKTRTHVRFTDYGTALYELHKDNEHLIVIFKNNAHKETFEFDEAFDMIYHSEVCENCQVEALELNYISTTILKRKADDNG